MKIFYVVTKDIESGQEVHRSDGFDNHQDAIQWGKDLDLAKSEYWCLVWEEEG